MKKPTCFRSFLTFTTFVAVSSVIISCTTPNSAESSGEFSSETKPAQAGEVPDEVSLKADRSVFESERKNISESTKKENDELAAVLSMMSNPDEEPSKVRDRFNTALRKKRDKNDKMLRERRESFMKKQRADREAFLKQSQTARTDFMKSKHSQDENKAFFEKQESKRKDFFDAANDALKEFDAKMNEDRKTFEDYVRERQNTFNASLRTYTETYQDRRNNLEKKKRAEQRARQLELRNESTTSVPNGSSNSASGASSDASDPLNEWKQIPKIPGTELTPKGN